MKKLLMIVMIVQLLLVGCGTNDVNTLNGVKEKGQLVLGTSADYPPYEYHRMVDGEDTIVGFDIEIAKLMANALDVELVIVDMRFDGLLASLQSGKVDIVIAGLTPTEDRKKNIDFSQVYYDAMQTIIVNSDTVGLTDSQAFESKKIGVQKGSIQEKLAMETFENAEILSLGKITDLVIALQSKKVDGIILAEPVAKSYVEGNSSLSLTGIDLGREDGVAIGIKKGNESLKAKIDELLNEYLLDGTIEKVIATEILSADQ